MSNLPPNPKSLSEIISELQGPSVSEQIVVKSVWMSSFGIYMESRGCIDIQSENGRWFQGLPAMWRRSPVPGDTILINEYGYSFPDDKEAPLA